MNLLQLGVGGNDVPKNAPLTLMKYKWFFAGYQKPAKLVKIFNYYLKRRNDKDRGESTRRRDDGERVKGKRNDGERVKGRRYDGERVKGRRYDGERVKGRRDDGERVKGIRDDREGKREKG